MVRIPTPLPRSLVKWGRALLSGALVVVLWRLALIAAFLFILALATAAGPSFFVATLLGLVISVLWSDNIRALVLDLWNLDFYSIKI